MCVCVDVFCYQDDFFIMLFYVIIVDFSFVALEIIVRCIYNKEDKQFSVTSVEYPTV